MARCDVIMPTEQEDAAINRGIAEDPDTVEWTDGMFASAVRFEDAGPDLVPDSVRRRGPQKAALKVPVSVRLDADVVEAFKSGGPGWQTRINDALRKHVAEQRST